MGTDAGACTITGLGGTIRTDEETVDPPEDADVVAEVPPVPLVCPGCRMIAILGALLTTGG